MMDDYRACDDGSTYDHDENDAPVLNTPADLGYPEYATCDDMLEDAEYNEAADFAYMCGFSISCFGSVIVALIALFSRKAQHMIIQQQAVQYVQPVVQQQMVQQPVAQMGAPPPQAPAVRIPEPPAEKQAEALKAQFEQQKKVEHLKMAQQRELARDYDAAIREYEAAGEFSEAGRIRQLLNDQGRGTGSAAAPVQVNIGQVGNSVVQDSVVMGGQQPPASSTLPPAPTACSQCNATIEPGWQFCPACNTPLI